MNSEKSRYILPLIALICLLGIVVYYLSSSRQNNQQVSTSQPEKEFLEKGILINIHEPEVEIVGDETPLQETPDEQAGLDFDPAELQPRNWETDDFRGLSQLPEGFTVENLELTPDGIKLGDEGEEGAPRTGMLYSPPKFMDFPSNAVSPLWLEDRPEGTDIFVEVSMSPDGENWGMWHWVEPDEHGLDAINEFYPDGSPNPHYGYTPGLNLAWGLKQWEHVKYRVTLYADPDVDISPLLAAFRLYYQDSTLGEGRLAEVVEDTDNPDLSP